MCNVTILFSHIPNYMESVSSLLRMRTDMRTGDCCCDKHIWNSDGNVTVIIVSGASFSHLFRVSTEQSIALCQKLQFLLFLVPNSPATVNAAEYGRFVMQDT
jgi:hypothetical protein